MKSIWWESMKEDLMGVNEVDLVGVNEEYLVGVNERGSCGSR